MDADSSSLFRLLHSSGAPSSAVAAVAAAAAAAVSAGLPLDSHLSAVSGMSARSAASSQIGGLGQRNPSTGGQGISGPSIGHGLSGQTLSSTSVASNGIMLPQSHSSCAVGSGSGGNTQQQQRQLVQMLMELQLKSQNSSNGLSNGLISAEDIVKK
ncbi:unnamed protein product [Protopolystoma xenopodis]|uniref:Uncharacterized protein n=1 Tax=Protopolystoma xenopodis TaxID=117903 RepID=A0A3S5C1Y3_9PLAT|nr:unnamed protein product [Protopolystoma xenopodis]